MEDRWGRGGVGRQRNGRWRQTNKWQMEAGAAGEGKGGDSEEG